MSLRDCPKNKRHGPTERVAEAFQPQARHEAAQVVSDVFTARCSTCGDMKKWDAASLRRQHNEAVLAKNHAVAAEIKEALEGWGFPVGA